LLIFDDLPILFTIAWRKGSLMKVPFALSQKRKKLKRILSLILQTRARLVCV